MIADGHRRRRQRDHEPPPPPPPNAHLGCSRSKPARPKARRGNSPSPHPHSALSWRPRFLRARSSCHAGQRRCALLKTRGDLGSSALGCCRRSGGRAALHRRRALCKAALRLPTLWPQKPTTARVEAGRQVRLADPGARPRAIGCIQDANQDEEERKRETAPAELLTTAPAGCCRRPRRRCRCRSPAA